MYEQNDSLYDDLAWLNSVSIAIASEKLKVE